MAKLSDLTIDLTPLRASRDFRLMWMASTVSAIGSTLTRIAVPYVVYKETGNELALGAISGISLLPMLASSIVGGAIADVFERRRISMLASAIGALCAVAHALNVAGGQPRIWLLYVVHTIAMCATMGGAPAMRSAVPFLIGKDLLPSALMMQSTTYTFSAVVGPAISGFIIGAFGAMWAFIIDALTFVWSMVCVARMRPIPPADKHAKVTAAFILDGVRALKGRRPIIGSFLADVNAMVFGMPLALMPAVYNQRYADSFGSDKYLGVLYAAVPFGMFVATIFSGWTKTITKHGRVVVLSIVVWGAAIVVFGFVNGFVVSLACLAIAGAADMISGVSRQAMLQLTATPEIQGRLQGVGMAVWTSGPALGDFEAGAVARAWSVDGSIWSGGLACIAGIALISALLPEFATFDSKKVALAADDDDHDEPRALSPT